MTSALEGEWGTQKADYNLLDVKFFNILQMSFKYGPSHEADHISRRAKMRRILIRCPLSNAYIASLDSISAVLSKLPYRKIAVRGQKKGVQYDCVAK